MMSLILSLRVSRQSEGLRRTEKLHAKAGCERRSILSTIYLETKSFNSEFTKFLTINFVNVLQAYIQQLESSKLKLAQIEQDMQRARSQVHCSF